MLPGIEILNYNPHFQVLKSFTLFAECDANGIVYKDIKRIRDEYDVYALQFGDDLYVGATLALRSRISTHYRLLKLGKHHSKRVQAAFDDNGGFNVYILMRLDKVTPFAEQMVIRLLNPSLNITPPRGHNEHYNNIIWTAKRID